MDDPRPAPARVRTRLTNIPTSQYEALKARADALSVTRNDLLVAASMKAVDAHLRDLGRPERPLSLLFPSSLRADLGVPECLSNYVGAIPIAFAPEIIRSDDLPQALSAAAKKGRELDIAVGAAVNVGMVGVLFPFRLFRSGLRKLDLDEKSSFFTYLISSPRLPRDFVLPSNTIIDRVAIHGALSRRPPFGFVLMIFEGRVIVAYEYLSPCINEASVDSIDRRFQEAVAALLSG
jgi:hypothetical protein